MDKIHIKIKSGIGLLKSDNPEILSVVVTRQDICCLAQFMKWAVMQEILKLLYRIAQFMNWALRVFCYCPFHKLGNSAAQFMNWTVSQIGRNIYVHKQNMTELLSTFLCGYPISTFQKRQNRLKPAVRLCILQYYFLPPARF